MRTPHIRRASEDDSAAISALVPNLVPSATDDHHATFVIDGAAGPAAVLDLLQGERHLELAHLAAPDLDHARALQDFAETAARALRASRILLRSGAMSDVQSRALGYRNGVKQVAPDGVPVWRDGAAPFSQALYSRGTWAALALLVGLGSVSLAVFSGTTVTLAHVVVPALLCGAGTLFAFWQVLLLVKAAKRTSLSLFTMAATIAAVAALVVASLIHDRAMPALTELWNIHSGDSELGDLTVRASPDGRRLYVSGAYGTRSEEKVHAALKQHASIREVVLEGPGGRASAGFEIARAIRRARLATRVETACASACTIAFLGGVERTISPSGRLGFHSASFPGMDEGDMHESNRAIRNFLVNSAGVTPDFARKVIDTPAESMWVPSREELLAGKVITR